MTVGRYLVKRLEQAGVRHVFGVPGDYVLKFLDEFQASDIRFINTCNELNAGYASDAYGRMKGIGAACITYGVGGLSILNAVFGAFAERVPLVIISGSPSTTERLHPHLLHHTAGDMRLQRGIYEKITVASCVLTDAETAPRKIDETLASCVRYKRPVYIEIPLDMVSKECAEPREYEVTCIQSDKSALEKAVSETLDLIRSAKSPAVLAGVEIHRFNLRNELHMLLDLTGYPFATTILGKAVIPERHKQFVGVYYGHLGAEEPRRVVEDADLLLSLGALMTDVNLGIGSARLDESRMIVANSDNVRVRHHIYQNVSLADFIAALRERIPKGSATAKINHPSLLLKNNFTPDPGRKISLGRFYERINHFLDKGHVVVSDTGDSLFSSAALFLPEGVDYIGQAFYMSIGFSIPAALGVKFASPRRRTIVFVGDGAFQMTAQELSSLIRYKLNPVIFLFNNDGYTIERAIHDGPYNDIQMWRYSELPQVFGGGWGCVVRTEGELEAALKRTVDEPESLALIEVRLDRWDCSDALKKVGKALAPK
jgi:indolepyruvate decarboxylase